MSGPAYTFVPQPYSLFAADASCSRPESTSAAGTTCSGRRTATVPSLCRQLQQFGTSDAGCSPSTRGRGATRLAATARARRAPGRTTCRTPRRTTRRRLQSARRALGCDVHDHEQLQRHLLRDELDHVRVEQHHRDSDAGRAEYQMSGSGLNLTPAYGTCSPMTRARRSGTPGYHVLSGGNDTFHNGTLYDPYGALTVGGSGSNFDGFFEADTISDQRLQQHLHRRRPRQLPDRQRERPADVAGRPASSIPVSSRTQRRR